MFVNLGKINASFIQEIMKNFQHHCSKDDTFLLSDALTSLLPLICAKNSSGQSSLKMVIFENSS